MNLRQPHWWLLALATVLFAAGKSASVAGLLMMPSFVVAAVVPAIAARAHCGHSPA